jgi:hypothetical protein
MTDESIFLDDGYTASQTVPGQPGLHPELRVTYRPCLGRERLNYRAKLAGGDPASIDAYEIAALVQYKVTVNGTALTSKEQTAKLRPAVRAILLDLVFGYAPEEESADAKNSPSG